MRAITALRRRAYLELNPRRVGRPGLSLTNYFLVVVIVASTGLAVLETEPTLSRFATAYAVIETALGVIFSVEYLARVWSSPEGDKAVPAWRCRRAFIFSFAALADLAAIVASFAPVAGTGLVVLRWIRLARIFRLAKLGRMSRAIDHIVSAVASRREELLLSLVFGVALMLAAATALYAVEGAVQPDKFGSIPRALWWAVATLTTIGYGDVYPVTPMGKVLAAVVAMLSIGLIAMPTGILAAAFSDAMERNRRRSIDAEVESRES